MNTWTIIGIVLSAVAVIIAAMQWTISNAFKKGVNNQRIDDAHERIKKYDLKSDECERRFVRLEELKTDSKAFDQVKTLLESLQRQIDQKPPLFQAYSPIQLTELGEKIAKESGIYNAVDNNWPAIVSILDETISSSNPYDVQQACFDLAIGNLGETLLPQDVDALKMYVFNEGGNIAYYAQVVGIVIRDKYFHHKGIEIPE